MSYMPKIEMVATCKVCKKEIRADIDSEHAFGLFSFRMLSHFLEFSTHEFRIRLVRENNDPESAIMKGLGVPKNIS